MAVVLDRKTFEAPLVQVAMADGIVGVLPALGVRQREPPQK
jgi:hypothetical protein